MPVNMERYHKYLPIGVAFITFALTGCGGDFYSAAIKYGVRTDPLVTEDLNKEITQGQMEPDRPGLLPLMSIKDLQDSLNPMYPKRTELVEKGMVVDPTLLSAKDRAAIEKVLEEHFGTPGEPKVKADAKDVDKLNIGAKELKEGSRLYRIHCLHCHGVPGDGRGPTAKWVNPHPRDYRQGLFKFQSVDQVAGGLSGLPPRRADLRRTLEHGIEGTSMPSFVVLPGDDLEHLVSYVIHLSMRGNTEYSTIKDGFEYKNGKLEMAGKLKEPAEDDDELEAGNIEKYVTFQAKKIVNKWVMSASRAITPTKYPFEEVDWDLYKQDDPEQVKRFKEMKESIGRGLEIFTSKRGDCQRCHLDFGRRAEYTLDMWGNLKRPANLTLGVYRGGRRPVDLYYRIHSGINGSLMVPFGGALQTKNIDGTTRDEVWDVVNFIQVLPYPLMRKAYGLNIN
jgi:mono/diheme cytochrome c family protein